jgi:hypothetical protein
VVIATGRTSASVIKLLNGPLKAFPKPWFSITMSGPNVSPELRECCGLDKLNQLEPTWREKLKALPFDNAKVEEKIREVAREQNLTVYNPEEMMLKNTFGDSPWARWYILDLDSAKSAKVLEAFQRQLKQQFTELGFPISLTVFPKHVFAPGYHNEIRHKALGARQHVCLVTSPPSVNKGDAFDHMAQKLGIDSKQVVIVADGDNDLDLLKHDGRQIIAVPNSTDGFLAKAKALLSKGANVLLPKPHHKDGPDMLLDLLARK